MIHQYTLPEPLRFIHNKEVIWTAPDHSFADFGRKGRLKVRKWQDGTVSVRIEHEWCDVDELWLSELDLPKLSLGKDGIYECFLGAPQPSTPPM